MGNTEIDVQQIIPLFREVGLNSFLASQKDGFDTWLDPTGKRLSRNVIQKILLVRALAGNPKLLLLEEPWLGIEQPYQDQIKKILLKNFPGTTILIVSNDSRICRPM